MENTKPARRAVLLAGLSLGIFWLFRAGAAAETTGGPAASSLLTGTPGRSTTTPTLTPTITPTSTLPPGSESLHVAVSANELQIAEPIWVTIAVKPREGCYYYVYQITLTQSEFLFRYISPRTPLVGPPAGNPYTYRLMAVSEGETVFHALVYGEQYCPPYGWMWRHVWGDADLVRVSPIEQPLEHIYLPLVTDTAGRRGLVYQD